MLIVAFAAFALSAGFIVTGALLAPAATPFGYAAYAPAGSGAVATEPLAMPRMAAPPLTPTPLPKRAVGGVAPPLPVSSIEKIAYGLRLAGAAGRRVAVVGAMRNVGTTYAAITLARMLVQDASVVLVDLAFNAPNLSLLSDAPNAPGIADLVHGAASFGDIVTRDQYSDVHLVATGTVGSDGGMLAASPMLVTVIEALVRSYDHVVIDAGSATDVAVERFAALAPRAVLVASDSANPATRAVAERLTMAGFADVAVLVGGAQAVAA